MKTYVINIYDNNHQMSDSYMVVAEDELNAIKEVTIRLLNECDSNIDDINIQNIKEVTIQLINRHNNKQNIKEVR